MKPANLTSTLLTRKGQASPTLVGPSRAAVPLPPSPSLATLPLLRVKDVPPRQPAEPPANVEANRFAGAAHAAVDRRNRKSLRVDTGRHFGFRLEASRTGRSMQSLLIQALDEFLERDGPGTSGPDMAPGRRNGGGDLGSRREPSQTSGAEAGNGPTRAQ